MKRPIKVALWVVLVIVAGGIIAFVTWGLTPYGPGDVALLAMEGSQTVSVIDAPDGWEFAPRSVEPTVGLVLYPGGHVDARSYAPLATLIAEQGYLVVVPAMPLALAVLSPNAAEGALEAHPEIESWFVGGHSLGGAMSAQYAAKHSGDLDGLVLLAAYASGSADLSQTDLGVLDTYGGLDGVLNMENHRAGTALLPSASTTTVVIEGGNHAQFGDYGPQPGDNEATIRPAEQWARAAEEVGALIQESAGE